VLAEEVVDELLAGALAELGGGADVGVVDAWGIHAAVAGSGEDAARRALGASVEASWNFTRSLATRAFLERQGPGRIVLVAPASGAGPHADAARAGLENLARTLSIEWARYGVTAVAIAPGARTRPEEVAALTAFLSSPAGAYFSGCLLDMRGLAAAPG
jgi:NAD(P)-dependent dehydrogenase (short-subunit alcohol dehydrogenase family)